MIAATFLAAGAVYTLRNIRANELSWCNIEAEKGTAKTWQDTTFLPVLDRKIYSLEGNIPVR